jgi:hypothetical protein
MTPTAGNCRDRSGVANLVATIKRGREKLHYLNPLPIHEIAERWK